VLALRRQQLGQDAAGRTVWEAVTESRPVPAARAALVVCDVWDRHWCRGANARLAALLPRMGQVVAALREAGVLIVHAPSDTMAFYAGTPARMRALEAPVSPLPAPAPHAAPPLPVDAGDEGCDTPPDTPQRVWTRQHPGIVIDQARDVISDDGAELARVYQARGITTVLILGVHTNMCILQRSFAIKALVRQGLGAILVRDLTDAMYNPARPPYVDHETGTRLVVEYIEKFWCPTVAASDLLGGS
jgi:nicotinamidase-related amidase